MERKQRILVVGGGGFIGQHVLAKLAVQNVSLACLDLSRPKSMPRQVEWIGGSADDIQLLASAVSGCKTVIFLAASSLPASANVDLASEVSSHVRMVVKAAETCNDNGVERFVFASSGGTVYGSTDKEILTEFDPTLPLNAYGVSKLSIEHYLRVVSCFRGMKTVSLRVSNPFGPGQTANRGQGFIAAAMAAAWSGDKLPCWGDGSTVRDFIYVEDVAAAFAKACDYCGQSTIFNIGSGIGRSLQDVISDIEATTGRALNVEFAASRKIDVVRNVLDVSRASHLLSWQPLIPFRKGLERTAAWWQHQI